MARRQDLLPPFPLGVHFRISKAPPSLAKRPRVDLIHVKIENGRGVERLSNWLQRTADDRLPGGRRTSAPRLKLSANGIASAIAAVVGHHDWTKAQQAGLVVSRHRNLNYATVLGRWQNPS